MTVIPKDSLPGINSFIKNDKVKGKKGENVKKGEKFGKILNSKVNKPERPSNVLPKKVVDVTSISEESRDLLIAKKAIDNVSDVREDLVEKIKSQIKDGTYEIDLDLLADKLIDSGIFDDLI